MSKKKTPFEKGYDAGYYGGEMSNLTPDYVRGFNLGTDAYLEDVADETISGPGGHYHPADPRLDQGGS